jgi:NAD(P)-dependent dehydrogenase (short-subunit alcohol dehydrogenase family)
VHRVLVTGSSRGLGLELVRQCAAAGSHVVATCRNPAAADDLRAVRGDVQILKLDVTSDSDLAAVTRELDGQPIDLLFSNAAVLGGSRSRVHNLAVQPWLDAFETNVIGATRVAVALWPNVAVSQERKIVFIASRAGLARTAKAGGSYIYRTTKSAMNTAARMLALDLASEGVIVALVNPGHVRTGIGGKGAPLSVEESVTALRQVVERVDPESTGKLWDHDGSEMRL